METCKNYQVEFAEIAANGLTAYYARPCTLVATLSMKRISLCLVPWMVLTAAAHAAQARFADVLYTFHDSTPEHGYRVGDECFVPVETLSDFGWSVSSHGDTVDVKAEGASFSLATRQVAGQSCVPLRKGLERIGADSDWLTTSDTLEVFAPLDEIKLEDDKLDVAAPVSIKPSVFLLTAPSRVVVDLAGARLTDRTEKSLPSGARAVQWKPNVVRIVIDSPVAPTLPKDAIEPTRRVALDLTPQPQEVVTQTQTQPDVPPPSDPATQPPVVKQAMPATGPLPLVVDSATDKQTNLLIKLPDYLQGNPQFRNPDPSTLEVTLPNVQMTLPDGFQLDSEDVLSATTRIEGTSTILVLNLARPLGAEVWSAPDGVRIRLIRPDVGNGKLAGKVIVVDPGHGGHDRGAHDGGVNEKDLNLSIGKLLASQLAAEGATVIMTRKTDVFIPLDTRAAIANKSHADFFISCHINSTGGDGLQSGGITFHHKGKPICRLLAECIQQEIAKVSGLPNLGAWSDGKIYRSGFAVLRETNMPGVLLELGFINHPRDRKRIVTPEFQKAVTAAVVRGIKVFLGNATTSK